MHSKKYNTKNCISIKNVLTNFAFCSFVHYVRGFLIPITPFRSNNKNKGKRNLENFVDNSMAEVKAIKKPKQQIANTKKLFPRFKQKKRNTMFQ
jgi:hypothetical protein